MDKVVKRNYKEIKAVVKWNKDDIGGGDASTSTELLKKLWNISKQKTGAWRQDLHHLELKIG